MRLLNFLEALSRLPAEVWLLPPILILGTMTVGWLLLRSARLRRFRAIADRTGLTVRPKLMDASQVTGTFRGRSLTMTTANTRAFSFRRRWTLVTVDVKNPELLRVHLSRQDFVDRLFVAAGLTDIQIGDAAFDRQFLIQSDEPKVVKQLFRSQRFATRSSGPTSARPGWALRGCASTTGARSATRRTPNCCSRRRPHLPTPSMR